MMLTKQEAYELEYKLKSDLLLNDNLKHGFVLSFRREHYQHDDSLSAERISLGHKANYEALTSCVSIGRSKMNRVRQEKIGFFVKEEFQKGFFHLHCLADLSELERLRIPVQWYYEELQSYWSSTSLHKFNYYDSFNECKTPRVGWMKRLKHSPSLVGYQAKCLKNNTIVSNGAYYPSKGLLQQLKYWSKRKEQELCLLKNN